MLHRKKCQTASAARAKTEPEVELLAEYQATISQVCTFCILYVALSTA